MRVQAILDSSRHPISPQRLHTNQAIAGKCFRTQVLLHRERPSHRDGLKRDMIYNGMLLHAGALTQRCFQHRDACTPGAFGRRCFYTEMILAKRVFRPRHVYTQVPLHRDAFAHSCSYTLIRLRSAVTCKFFCAEILLHARIFTQTYLDIR